MKLKIQNKGIGNGEPCFIIAEAGSNFRIANNPETNMLQAKTLIHHASEAKVDAVKFQLFRADKLYVKNAGSADYIGTEKPMNDIIKEMELPYDWLPVLKEECDKSGLIFLCTPFDEQSVDELEKIDIAAYKIASYSITHLPFLKYVASKGKPIIISTGASTEDEISKAVYTIRKENAVPVALMQCTAKYPAPLNTINLRTIPYFKTRFNNRPVGLSDHSREPYTAPLGAVALGADIIEKHFTTSNCLPGPDHGFAITNQELVELVKRVRLMEQCLGDSIKAIQKEEQELYNFCRHRIYAAEDIKRGDTFSKTNLTILRSGKADKGLEPSEYENIIGKKSIKAVSNGNPITEYCLPVKNLAIIQARMGSTRLPRKTLEDVEGKPLLLRVVERVKQCEKIDKIVIATTTEKEDDEIVRFAEAHNLCYHRGSVNNLMERFFETATKFNAENIVRIWGDCPLVDPDVIDMVISGYEVDKRDYDSNLNPPTFPRGLDVEVFSFDVLKRMRYEVSTYLEKGRKFYQEYMTDLIRKNPDNFKFGNLRYEKNVSDQNWTVDYKEDLNFTRSIYTYFKDKPFGFEDVFKYLKKNPHLLELKKGLKRYEDYEKAQGALK